MTIEDKQQISVRRKRKWAWWLFWLLLLGLLVTVTYHSRAYLQQAKQHEQEDRPGKGRVAVSALPVLQQDVPVYLQGLGTVTSLRTVTVKSRIEGELVRVVFQEGQKVQAGDLLAEIDARAIEVQLRQAEGQLLRDEAILKNAEIDLARYKTLLAQDSISAQQAATQDALVKQYKGTVAIDRTLIDSAKLQLSYTKITAPITGRVGLRLLDQGNMVRAADNTGLAVITQFQPIAVVFTLPEDAVPKVLQQQQAGHPLLVEAYDRGGKLKLGEGRLLAVDNQIDLNTGTVKLKSQFDNHDALLFPNQFVNVRMLIEQLPAALTVPSTAIQNGSRGAYVYVVQDQQTVSVRPVKLGPVFEDRVVVTEGVQIGELLVVDGADKLRDGATVKLIEARSEHTPVPNPLKPKAHPVRHEP